MRITTVVLFFVFSLLAIACNSSSGRRTSPPPPTYQPPPTPPPEFEPLFRCQYISQSQKVYGPSCIKKFCYTWSRCQGFLRPRFLFCEGFQNEYGNWKCPDASACAMAPEPGFHYLQYSASCSVGGSSSGGDDDEGDDDNANSKPRFHEPSEDLP